MQDPVQKLILERCEELTTYIDRDTKRVQELIYLINIAHEERVNLMNSSEYSGPDIERYGFTPAKLWVKDTKDSS